MMCRCFGREFDTASWGDAARLMLGLPRYAAYVAHARSRHPEAEILDEAAFYRAQQEGVRFRCC